MDLTKILEVTVSPDTSELDVAQKYLEGCAQSNLPDFLVALSQILADTSKTSIARTAAGLQLKNHLTSKDPEVRVQHQQRWLTLDPNVRLKVKTYVLQTLGTEDHKLRSASQCVASIACAELPRGEWPEVIKQLVVNVRTPTSTALLKESSLEAIGYICQDIEPQYIAAFSDDILTAIVQGVRKEELDVSVKLAATNALLNSLEFTKANFENETERNFIMQVTCEATQSGDVHVKVAALQCLVKIVSLYYQHMEMYMEPALFAISVDAMKSPIDDVALQGIEFWSNVCDEEMDLQIELQEADEMGTTPEHVSRLYARGALEYLIPILLEKLTKQEENEDDDEWNPCKAAGVCLMLLANCCENAVVNHVLPFITLNIRNQDWHYRDAAVMAFGSILEGPDADELKKIVTEAVPVLIQLFDDQNVVVRDTVAWTVGRICELIPGAIIAHENFQSLLEALLKSLDSEPRVASNVCWAFSSLAENAYDAAFNDETEEPETYCLSGNFEVIVAKLLQTTLRQDAHMANLRSAAYEALMEMVKNSAKDCYVTVQKTTIEILQRINFLQMDQKVEPSERMQYQDLQSLLCATLQSVLRKMKKEDAHQIADNIMEALLKMFQSTSQNSGGGVQEDVFVAVGTLVESIGVEFMKYMEMFLPFLHAGLQNTAEYQVCLASVGLVGDLCRALNTQIFPMCEAIMGFLMGNLADQTVNRMIKPQILSVFGDIALAIGPKFQPYLPYVLKMLKEASQAQVDKTDYDMIDYLNELREGCLEGYTGIIQGLKGDSVPVSSDVEQIYPEVDHILKFIECIQQDEDHTDSNIAAASGVLGDLCCAFGDKVVTKFNTTSIQELLTEGKRSKAHKTKTLATWALKEIRKVSNTIQQ